MAVVKKVSEAERQRAIALTRWEGEGGALGTSREPSQALDETELRILVRLGAAALLEWQTVPPNVQDAIFACAKRLRPATDSARVKAEIARFMREHAED